MNTKDGQILFCRQFYEKIQETVKSMDPIKIKEIMIDMDTYLMKKNSDGEKVLNTDLINLLKDVSHHEVKPIWEKTSDGVNIMIRVGLQYKDIVFSFCQ